VLRHGTARPGRVYASCTRRCTFSASPITPDGSDTGDEEAPGLASRGPTTVVRERGDDCCFSPALELLLRLQHGPPFHQFHGQPWTVADGRWHTGIFPSPSSAGARPSPPPRLLLTRPRRFCLSTRPFPIVRPLLVAVVVVASSSPPIIIMGRLWLWLS
jgi:hypothetical protein